MNPKNSSSNRLINQVISAMIQNHPFDAKLPITAASPWTPDLVSDILRSIPRFFFLSPRSIGRQNSHRHRSPLKQRNRKAESIKRHNNVLILGPAAYRDPEKVSLGLNKAIEFYYWVEETKLGFSHNEMTCREMARLLIRGDNLKNLYDFLLEMSNRGRDNNNNNNNLVTTPTITCLIKVLGEEGLVKDALAVFNRMNRYHCKPDVYAYNTIIYALCRIGNYQKARFLLHRMELPGFRCPPDTYTYTIMISSYCKHSMHTGCRKAIRRRLWEANHLFRIMLFNGFIPDVVTYNCLIDGCCKTNRIGRALELFEDMSKKGVTPNRITYNSFIRYYSTVNEIDMAFEMMKKMQKMNHGIPTSSSYTPVIHALCEVGRVIEARDFLVELVEAGEIPREYTYKVVCDGLNSVGETELLDDELRERIEDGIERRYRRVIEMKPIMSRRNVVS